MVVLLAKGTCRVIKPKTLPLVCQRTGSRSGLPGDSNTHHASASSQHMSQISTNKREVEEGELTGRL